MNKSDLITLVTEQTGIPRNATVSTVNAVLDTVKDALTRGEDVHFPGFGTFSVKKLSARKGRNLQTGKTVLIPASRTPSFKAGKNLKDSVKGKKEE